MSYKTHYHKRFIGSIDTNSKYNICDIHGEMISMAEDLQRMRVNDFDDVESAINNIVNKLDDIIALGYVAMEYGQSMENRLKLYRESIEELGFVREKKQ